MYLRCYPRPDGVATSAKTRLVLRAASLLILGLFGAQAQQASAQSNPSIDIALAAAPSPFINEPHSLAQTRPGWPWRTDTTKRTVALSEFQMMLGRDAIPPIDQPRFVVAAKSLNACPDREPAIVLTYGDQARAYPLRLLLWHEIVNDRIGGVPVAVTFCPLCHAAVVFDRRVEKDGKAQLLDFGTSGLLRTSDLVMWDRQTESWWQQMTGEALVGAYAGTELKLLPAAVRSCAAFREAHPSGQVLVPQDPNLRPYGRTPYAGYENNQPFALNGEPDPRLPATSRVVGICRNGTCRAYPWDLLAASGLIEDTVGGESIAIFYAPGALAVMDAEKLVDSYDAGQVAVYAADRNGRRMRFSRAPEGWEDRHGDVWRLDGRCTSGSEEGEALSPLVYHGVYAFAWFRFFPNSGLYAVPDNR